METTEPLGAAAPVAGPGPLGHLAAVLIAVLGGALGILGAFIEEVRSGGFILLPFIGAPVIEEMLKPLGLYLLLARWPRLLLGQLHTAVLSALAGLTFGVIEALVYVNVYVSDPPDWFVAYRFSLPLLLHTTASFIVGLGVSPGLLAWASRGEPFPRASRNFYIAGIALHALFNITATALALAGVLDVD